MKEHHDDLNVKNRRNLICQWLGHDFDPITACSEEDEYCRRCGQKCDEQERWFELRWWLKWKLLPLKRWTTKIAGARDHFCF